MALRLGIVCCIKRSLGLTAAQSGLSTSCTPHLSQQHNLSTLNRVPFAFNHCLQPSSNHVSKIFGSNLTSPDRSQTVLMQQIRNYHSVLRPRLHCKGCYFVWRHGRKYVECSDVPSHKQMKKVANRKLWKEDYTKGNVRKAMNWNRDLLRIDDRICDRTALSHNWLASRIGKDV